MKNKSIKSLVLLVVLFILTSELYATDYHVGSNQAYTSINAVPWESMLAGDNVYIHWRSVAEGGAYHEKWVINVAGTEESPFVVSGVLGPNGERPVIDGNAALTRTQLNYWGGDRSIIKIGGSSIPDNETASFIIIENLEIHSANPDYSFTDDGGNQMDYKNLAASIFIETGNNIIVRNCVIYNSGNGIFSAWESSNVLIEKNYIYGNGNEGRIYEHNAYTESTNITYQYNRFGPLRSGAGGNNLKDRSAGLVVRYNWIQGGNRLLDLVESEFDSYYNNPVYRKTFVYGNILIEEEGGNPQAIHYGGDNGDETIYRKGKLYFYNNTLYSVRTDNTTLIRLSSNDEFADIRNNILFVTAVGSTLALLDDAGHATIKNNWIKPGWVNSHSGTISGTIDNDESNIESSNPGFVNATSYDFHLLKSSSAINKGTSLLADVISEHGLTMEYKTHQDSTSRAINGVLDIGAYEYDSEIVTGMLNNMLPEKEKYQLYPNPVKNNLFFNLEDAVKDGKVYTLAGKAIFSFDKSNNNQIDVSKLNRGTYLLELNTLEGKTVLKFIKK